MKMFIIIGAISAMLSVAIGAFGSHGLEGRILKNTWKFGKQVCNIKCSIVQAFLLLVFL